MRAQIYGRVPPGQLQAEVADCQRLVRPHATSAVDFFVQRYQYLRQFAPAFLETFSFRSSQPHDPLLEAVSRVRELNAQGKSKIPVEWYMPLAFVRAVWHPYVVKREGTLERHAYELCVLWELRNALRAGNVWLEGSRRYADPESYLIPRERWPGLRSEVCQLLDLPFD